MIVTDEEVIDAFFKEHGIRGAARKLKLSHQTVGNYLRGMQAAGVEVPRLNQAGGRKTVYTPERVAELNEYIRRKTESTNVAGQG